MSAIWIALLALVAIGVAVYPLFKPARLVRVRASHAALENLLAQREATYRAIKDLEFDHAQGKLSDADYADVRAKYETKALAILQQLDGFGKPVVKSDARLLHLPKSGCPRCGEPFEWNDRFCRSCGAALAQVCGTCGTAVSAEDKFCARCGAAVAALPPAT